jgi:hypothetical protein
MLLTVASAQKRKSRNITINDSDDGSIVISPDGKGRLLTECGQLRMKIGDDEPIRSQQEQIVAKSAVSSLRVKAARNGGINVQGWDRDEYAIKLCLAIAADSDVPAAELQNQIKLLVQNGEVSIQGPDTSDWVGYLLIMSPRSATLDMHSYNGPITVSDVAGTIEGHTLNGPLTFRNVSGRVRGEAQNGPITVAGGSSGDYSLQAQNGPLTLVLPDGNWDGQIEGRTQNGPLTLKISDGFRSSVLVEASKHSPVTCRAAACAKSPRSWDRPNEIKFGDSEPVVRLSTVNGPVTIVSDDR